MLRYCRTMLPHSLSRREIDGGDPSPRVLGAGAFNSIQDDNLAIGRQGRVADRHVEVADDPDGRFRVSGRASCIPSRSARVASGSQTCHKGAFPGRSSRPGSGSGGPSSGKASLSQSPIGRSVHVLTISPVSISQRQAVRFAAKAIRRLVGADGEPRVIRDRRRRGPGGCIGPCPVARSHTPISKPCDIAKTRRPPGEKKARSGRVASPWSGRTPRPNSRSTIFTEFMLGIGIVVSAPTTKRRPSDARARATG